MFIILGLTLDLGFNEAEIVGEQVEKTLLDKSKEIQTVYIYKPISIIPKIISNLLYGISASILILFFVERRIAMEEVDILKREVDKNIFNGVLKKIIPEEIFNKFNKDIFQTDLIRKNAHWTYEITKNNKNSYNVKQSIRYELHNLNDYKVEPTLPIHIDSTLSFVKSKLTSITVLNSDKTEQNEFNPTDKKVVINGNSFIEVTMIVDNEYEHQSIIDVHNSMFSIIGLTIETIQPSDVSVKIQPSFLKELNKINTGLTTSTKYEPIDCILKGQGVSYIIEPITVNDKKGNFSSNNSFGENRILNE